MDKHPQFPKIQQIASKYPDQGPLLFTVFMDLLLVKRFEDLQARANEDIGVGYITGRRMNDENDEIQTIIPISAEKTSSMSSLDALYESFTQTTIVLAIVANDSTISYYFLSTKTAGTL